MKCVLHIDQSNLFRNIVKDILTKKGLTYLGANNSENAMKALKDNNVKLIITSLELADVTGIEYITALNASSYQNIPVIVVTSTDSLKIREQIFSLGVIDYILKKDLSYERFDWYIDNLLKEDNLIKELQGMYIAVLDDSRYSLNVIRNIFEVNSIYRVDYFNDAKKLLASSKNYSVFLLDYIIPDISGKELILELRSRNQNSVIISISGISNYKTVSNILIAGANDYIMKPFDKNIFMARLKTNVRTLLLVKKLERMAITDSLTSMYNHKFTYKKLEEEIKNAEDNNIRLSVAMFDIDHFKSVNDNWGHQTGDLILVKTANIIKSCLPQGALLGRYGGEEFLAVLPGMDRAGAAKIAEAVRQRVEGVSFSIPELSVTISGGVAEWEGNNAMALVNRADAQLYRAKELGRNRIEV